MKKLQISAVCVVATFVALASGALWWFQKKSMPVVFAEDAVGVIAYEASDLFEKNPDTTNDEVAEMIRSLHEASVINLKIDSNNKTVDPFGTEFRVENRISASKSVTTVVSAGPDRQFGTEDDISQKHERETKPQEGDGV